MSSPGADGTSLGDHDVSLVGAMVARICVGSICRSPKKMCPRVLTIAVDVEIPEPFTHNAGYKAGGSGSDVAVGGGKTSEVTETPEIELELAEDIHRKEQHKENQRGKNLISGEAA